MKVFMADKYDYHRYILRGDCLLTCLKKKKKVKNRSGKFASPAKDLEGEDLFRRKFMSLIKDEEAQVALARSSHPCLKMKEACIIQLQAYIHIQVQKRPGFMQPERSYPGCSYYVPS